MNEQQPNPELLRLAAEGLLDSLPDLKTDPRSTDRSKGLSQQIARLALMPSALLLTERGHRFRAETHTGEALVQEVLDLCEAYDIPEELVSKLKERYGGSVNWAEEADLLSDPTQVHPLDQLNQIIGKYLSEDAQKTLAKISYYY